MASQQQPSQPRKANLRHLLASRADLRCWPSVTAALALTVLAAGGYAWHSGLAQRITGSFVTDDKLATSSRLSIIVLPFENLSGDKEQDYFADAITDDLTTDLSHLEDSSVISRGTAFTYKRKQIAQIYVTLLPAA